MARFRASYGVNEAIEPRLDATDKPLFDRVAPMIADNPQAALNTLLAELRPDSNPAFHFLAGNLQYQLGNYQSAEGHLARAIEMLPSFRRAHRTLSLIHVQRSDFARGTGSLLEVIRLGGGDAQSYGLLAYCYLKLEKYQSSLVAYRQARMFDPDSIDFRRGEAYCLSMTGEPEQSVALYDELLMANPTDPELWLMQVNGLMDMDRRVDAIANLLAAVRLGKNDWQTQTMLGGLFLQENLPARAGEFYLAALDAAVSAPAVSREVPMEDLLKPLDNLIRFQQLDSASLYLGKLRAMAGATENPRQSVEFDFREASIHFEKDQLAQARAMAESVLDRDPLMGHALILLGRIHARNSEYENALLSLRRAANLEEFRHEALIELARLHVKRREYQQALENLRRARQARPSAYLDQYIDGLEKAMDALD